MPKNDPYKDSPYDSSGMPLGAESVDYDDKGEVAQRMVKDKYVASADITQIDFDHSVVEHDWQKRTKFNPALQNTAVEVVGHKMPTKRDHIGTGIPEANPKTVDLGVPKKEEPKKDNKDDDDFKKALKDV